MKLLYKISLIMVLFISLCTTACKSGQEDHDGHQTQGEYYTCPMHPTVRSDRPGTCPICNMTLVKVSSITKDTAANTIQIVKEQQHLANISFDTVKRMMVNTGLKVSGTTTFNENRSSFITSRAKGRIEKLVKRTPGEMVRKGELLYTLYSEELLTMEKEYVSALKQGDQFRNEKAVTAMINAARQRLILAGVAEALVSELEKNRKTHNSIPFYSETSGTIIDIPVKEGGYVETGTTIYNITDIGSLWVDAQLYSNEIQQAQNTTATAEIEGKVYRLKPELVSPVFSENTKVNTVRFIIAEPSSGLKPGMRAFIRLSGKEESKLVIPKRSVLLGKMPMVWVKKSDDLFENRMIETGIESGEHIEVRSGLNEGEIVVSSGAYLVNSEFILKKGAKVQHQH